MRIIDQLDNWSDDLLWVQQTIPARSNYHLLIIIDNGDYPLTYFQNGLPENPPFPSCLKLISQLAMFDYQRLRNKISVYTTTIDISIYNTTI